MYINKFLQRLFLFKKYTIQSKLSKQQILDRVKSLHHKVTSSRHAKAWRDFTIKVNKIQQIFEASCICRVANV